MVGSQNHATIVKDVLFIQYKLATSSTRHTWNIHVTCTTKCNTTQGHAMIHVYDLMSVLMLLVIQGFVYCHSDHHIIDTFNTISALIYVVQISWVLRMGWHIIPTTAIHLHCMTDIQIKYIFKAIPFSKIFIDKNCFIYTNDLTCASC